jgi:hypothetical protein
MKICTALFTAILVLLGPVVWAQETPPPMVESYDALADTILALRRAERGFVRSLLDGHFHGATQRMKNGDWNGAAAEMALFANEGDNAVGGVRKKLLEGGHHFNAEGEERGLYEPGFVVVTQEAKKEVLAAAVALRQASDDPARQTAWDAFAAIAKKILAKE